LADKTNGNNIEMHSQTHDMCEESASDQRENLNTLAAERIHQMLKMFASQGQGFEFLQEELKSFLQRKVSEHKLLSEGPFIICQKFFLKVNRNLLFKKICVNFVRTRSAHRHHQT
jgi:hypothetical protein